MDFQQIWSNFEMYIMSYGWNLVYAIVILIVGLFVAKGLKSATMKILNKRNVEPTLGTFVANITYAILLIFVFLAVLSKIGIETTSLIAIVGAAGLAVGLALQGSLANFAAGFLLISLKIYRQGEYIEAGGTAGTVEDLSILTTTMKSPDNVEITVPNSEIMSGSIKNYSRKETRRIDLVVGVGYDDDLKKTKEVLNDIISKESRVLEDPAPTIAVAELADSSVNFVVRPWVKGSDYWAVRFDLIEAIKLRLDEEGINIPYPQRDVHLLQDNAA